MAKTMRKLTHTHIDEVEASDNIASILLENRVCLGGSSMGKGFVTAARYYLNNYLTNRPPLECLQEPQAHLLNADTLGEENDRRLPIEDSFYVVDIGIVISQYYQWRKFFPRVECFYAVKCNPDPVIVKTLACLGANFDCASRNEIRLVKKVTAELNMSRSPEIIYANPCKARLHMIEAVCKGVTLVTFDNVPEVAKCASVSKSIELVMRIVTDDKGSQCRLSSKFGAPRNRWRPLLKAAKQYGMKVVGVSFHVGSGCRDASRYELALRDAREIFDMAEKEYGFKMNLLDIGGGFPGETHSTWNPTDIDNEDEDNDDNENEGLDGTEAKNEKKTGEQFMYFTEIATEVAPMIDELFPEGSGVRIIAEPGRYFSAAAATLVASVVASRNAAIDDNLDPTPINDKEASQNIDNMTREEEDLVVRQRAASFSEDTGEVLESIADELADYSKLFIRQHLSQQEADVYNDSLDLYKAGFETSIDLLGPPSTEQKKEVFHTVEGMDINLVNSCVDDTTDSNVLPTGMLGFAAAGEAAVNGVVLQSLVDSGGDSDHFAYYINDGVYSAFNNLMYDHAVVRPRHLKKTSLNRENEVIAKIRKDGLIQLEDIGNQPIQPPSQDLYASTVFGPTCDSIDVITRSVLLPKLDIGDWLYFQNMGAYTMAASSCFNGFEPSEKFYVCSVPLQYLEKIISGSNTMKSNEIEEEKKE